MRVSGQTQRIGILLLPRFPLLAFSAAIIPLQEANRCAAKSLYETMSLSVDGAPVVAEGGIAITPDRALSDAQGLDAAFVCAGFDPKRYAEPKVLSWIRLQ